jgi:hypothetical protein
VAGLIFPLSIFAFTFLTSVVMALVTEVRKYLQNVAALKHPSTSGLHRRHVVPSEPTPERLRCCSG